MRSWPLNPSLLPPPLHPAPPPGGTRPAGRWTDVKETQESIAGYEEEIDAFNMADPNISPPPPPEDVGVAEAAPATTLERSTPVATTPSQWARQSRRMQRALLRGKQRGSGTAKRASAVLRDDVTNGEEDADDEVDGESLSFLELSTAQKLSVTKAAEKAELEEQFLRDIEELEAERASHELSGNSSDLERRDWRCCVELFFSDGHAKVRSPSLSHPISHAPPLLLYPPHVPVPGNPLLLQDHGRFEVRQQQIRELHQSTQVDVIRRQCACPSMHVPPFAPCCPPPHPASTAQVCNYVKVYDEDEGCGSSTDAVIIREGGIRGLTDDVHNDAAGYKVVVRPKPPPPPPPRRPPPPSPPPKLGPQEETVQSNGDVVTTNVPRSVIGMRVGSCTCPVRPSAPLHTRRHPPQLTASRAWASQDGKVYEVGDTNRGEGVCQPSCQGGIPKKPYGPNKDQCKKSDGPSSHMSVKCSEEHGELAEEALDDYAQYEALLKEAEDMLVACKDNKGKILDEVTAVKGKCPKPAVGLKYPKGKDDVDYKEKMKAALKKLSDAKAKFRKLRGAEPTQTFPKNSRKINSFEPHYTFFSEFGTHWQTYAQMGARYGLKVRRSGARTPD